MTTNSLLDQGREYFRQQAWSDAYTQLLAADQEDLLSPEDLDCLARAAYLIGKDSEYAEIWARAHHGFLNQGDLEQAASCAFWLGLALLNKGEKARGGGWVARTRRLVEDHQLDCVEQGFLLLPVGLGCLSKGDVTGAYASFTEAEDFGKRFQNPDLITLGRLGRGQALIRQHKIDSGMDLLDEAMVAVEAGEVSPISAGIVYCAVIETCQNIYDLKRAQEWTAALSQWCASQPDLAPYRGQCLVRRAEIMQLHGAWPDAMDEAQRACSQLTRPPGEPAAGLAYYRQAELHRLKGEFSRAEQAYRQAAKWGKKPQPGLALLRLAQGQIDPAKTAIDRVKNETQDRMMLATVLSAYVDIMLEANEVQAARTASDELSEIADDFDIMFLHALAGYCQGAVLLAEDNIPSALATLRQAWATWEDLEAPYEAARVRVLIGLACKKLGDKDSAGIELEAAKWIFEQLGAEPDINKIKSMTRDSAPRNSHGLTPRELQVLRRMATGKTNKDIASELFISERTVDRHVSNILSKLNASSRTAATAYAYEHKLI